MDFLTILSYILAVVETTALLATLVYVTRAMHEKKAQKNKQGKKGGKSAEATQKSVSLCYRNAGIAFMIYLILNVIRLHSGIFG